MELNNLLQTGKIDLYVVKESWCEVEHDSPCLGAMSKSECYEKLIAIYAEESSAKKASGGLLGDLEHKLSKVDMFDRMRIAVQHGVSFNSGRDYEYTFETKKISVSVKGLSEKKGKVYVKLNDKDWEVN